MGIDKEIYFRKIAKDKIVPMPGLIQFLEDTKHIPKCCVTNAPKENAEFMLEVAKVKHYFPFIILGSDVSRPKPYPDPYLEAMKRLNVSPDKCVIFEDSPSGLKAASSSGAGIVCGLLTGHTRDSLITNGATMVVKDFTEVSMEKLNNFIKEKNWQASLEVGIFETLAAFSNNISGGANESSNDDDPQEHSNNDTCKL